MRGKWLLAVVFLASLVGVAWAQTPPADTPLFVPYQQIGERRPGGILYEPQFDRMAWVDLDGRLVLVDATTYQTQHILYTQGAYNAYEFSHDGRHLALAIDQRVELWDTGTGTLRATFEPTGANLVQGPLIFTPDDRWLLLDTVVPAPQETRRSENDTSIIPWLWDIPAALDEAPSRLNGAEGAAFFNFRNGLVVGGDTFLIAGIPGRLQIIDGRSNDFTVIADIFSSRLERDPIYVWESAAQDLLYADPQSGSAIVQIDGQTGVQFYIPLGRDVSYRNLGEMRDLRLGETAKVLCQPNSLRENSLLRLLLGEGYPSYQNYLPLTYMLIDVLEPLSTGAARPALLIYVFNDTYGRGVFELFYPQDIQHLRLSPDGTQLMVRRASGLQPIELYDLATCTLERTIYPAEPDGSGIRPLEYSADGSQILSDFQRFDVQTGAMLTYEPEYTSGFEQYVFSADSRRLHTIRTGELLMWDIDTAQLLQRVPLTLSGEVIARSLDATRFLTQTIGSDIVIESVDILGGERSQLVIPISRLGSLNRLIPSPDWQRVLVVVQPALSETGGSAPDIAVYDFEAGQLLYVASADLPPNAYEFGWIDNQNIYVIGDAASRLPVRPYDLDYDASGLPVCLVEAFPDEYQAWLPIWENLTLRLSAPQLARLTTRLCAALPASADGFVPALTPTPAFVYNSLNTPVPYAIPGVPICLTSRFANRAVDYAALWREIIADLNEEQITLLEEMICEGLISSPFGVAPTPTIDPNLNVPPTPTPADAAPQTTEQTQRGDQLVYTIDVESSSRSAANYLPPLLRPTAPDTSLLFNLYARQFNGAPTNPVLSPDGRLFAVTDPEGFVVIYRVSRTYGELLADETNAAATRAEGSVRSIGLLPTATQPFDFVGNVRPTLTPTITPTAPAPPQVAQPLIGWTNVCPARELYTLANAPDDFDARGRIFAAPPPNAFQSVWVLEPETGSFTGDDSLPRCGLGENCNYTFDGNWMVRVGTSVIVSRPDGSQATTLFRPEEAPYFPQSLRWLDNAVLEYGYPGFLPDGQPSSQPITIYRQFDVTTGLRSEPFVPELVVSIEDLPTTIQSIQPFEGRWLLVTTPYPPYGAKYYLYDKTTGEYQYFARDEFASLNASWHPTGRALFYTHPQDPNVTYFFNTATTEHGRLSAGLPSGTWSRDGRYRADWYQMPSHEYQARITNGELPDKLVIWDSVTGMYRTYCLPESGLGGTFYGTPLSWSPDNRYLAFIVTLPPDGDVFTTPMPQYPTPGTATPTITPVPLEAQYQYGFPRTLILDTQTGNVVIASDEVSSILLWTDDGGAP
jgi:hypothetical protein